MASVLPTAAASMCSSPRPQAAALVDCAGGFGANITSAQCVARQCCFNANANASSQRCTYSAAGMPVTTVHVIASNHFDAGYASLTADVVNEYFTKYFKRAARVGATFGKPLYWLTHSWLVSLYMDCPPGMRLQCPNNDEKAAFSAAVKAGHITWHALPFNAELALGSLGFSVQLTHDLDKRFGLAPKATGSTRDVPGMTRAALRTLRASGVRALSEGMNTRMVPVNVPPAFRWRDPVTNSSVFALWHWHGYGSIEKDSKPGETRRDPDPSLRVPASSHALVYAWRGDNEGPPTGVLEILEVLSLAQRQFPTATDVRLSTFDAFVSAVEAEGAVAKLPTIEKELADSWIFGAPSDPLKLARLRVWQRQVAACRAAREGECAPASTPTQSPLYNASRLALKGVEHTWGVSVSHYGKWKDDGWSNADLRQLRAFSKEIRYMESSWVEQRQWAHDHPLEALGARSVLAQRIRDESDLLEPTAEPQPVREGYIRVSNPTAAAFTLGGASLRVDARGALVSLVAAGTEWSGADAPLLLLQYQSLVLADFEKWWAEYIVGSWGQIGTSGADEYGKPAGFMHGLPGGANVTHQLVAPKLVAAWQKTANGHRDDAGWASVDSLLLQLRWPTALHELYGAPASAWVRLEALKPAAGAAGVNVTLYLFNKTSTRLPEALYVSHKPSVSAAGTWRMHVLGEEIDPLDVAEGASRGLHAVDTGVSLTSTDGAHLELATVDAPVIRWDEPLPFPTPLHSQPDLAKGVSYVLHDNIWNTNYPAWYPFEGPGNLAFRFHLAAKHATPPGT